MHSSTALPLWRWLALFCALGLLPLSTSLLAAHAPASLGNTPPSSNPPTQHARTWVSSKTWQVSANAATYTVPVTVLVPATVGIAWNGATPATVRSGGKPRAWQDSAPPPTTRPTELAPGNLGPGNLGPGNLGPSVANAPLEGGGDGQPRSMLQMMFTGNPFGVGIVILILLLSVLSCILIVENAISIRRSRLLPPDVMQALESALALRDTRAALMICNDIDNHSLATQVVLAGLERFRSSEFGFAEYRSAVEEAGEHLTGRLYRKVEILNVIASIAPMLGLTGTVIGMIDAFNTIAAKQGVAGPEDLAGGIGQALITTLLGLLVAIPTMVAFSFFRTRIDALVSEAGTRIERLMLPLGRRKSS